MAWWKGTKAWKTVHERLRQGHDVSMVQLCVGDRRVVRQTSGLPYGQMPFLPDMPVYGEASRRSMAESSADVMAVTA